MIRLRQSITAQPDLPPIRLAGTLRGAVRILGPGFKADVDDRGPYDIRTLDHEAASHLANLLSQAKIPLPEADVRPDFC